MRREAADASDGDDKESAERRASIHADLVAGRSSVATEAWKEEPDLEGGPFKSS